MKEKIHHINTIKVLKKLLQKGDSIIRIHTFRINDLSRNTEAKKFCSTETIENIDADYVYIKTKKLTDFRHVLPLKYVKFDSNSTPYFHDENLY
ncbi:MAG: hypothetical protein Nk1A_7620 [Endomicrobiia bacterium]|nr:MAG: hypothetical protein Nk1A_7620 [Endomicrobiia bacterium]